MPAAALSALGLTPEEEIVYLRKSTPVTPCLALEGGSLRLSFQRHSKKEWMLSTWAAGLGPKSMTSSK